MFGGMPYLVAQIAVPCVLSALVGGLAGWLARAARDGRGAWEPAGAGVSDGRPMTALTVEAELSGALSDAAALREELSRLRDAKDTEMGRLETHAITAIESTVTRTGQRIATLEQELETVRSVLRRTEDELSTQRGQNERLRRAVSARDERIARLGEK